MTPRELMIEFRTREPKDRAGFLAETIAPMAASLRDITSITNLVDIDADAFHDGLQAALTQDPKNITAGRALIWFFIRDGDFSRAREIFTRLSTHWPHHSDIFFEQIRLQTLEEAPERVALFEHSDRHFKKPARRASSALQVYAGTPGFDADKARGDFDLVCKQARDALLQPPGSEDRLRLGAIEIDLLRQVSEKIIPARSVAVVGNAPTLKGAVRGAEIDAHDLVMRCNFPLLDQHRDDVGGKVDLVFFNESIRPSIPDLKKRSTLYDEVIAIGMHTDPGFGFDGTGIIAPAFPNVTTLPPRLRDFIQDVCYSRATTGLMAITLLCLLFNKKLTIYGFDFFQNKEEAHYFDRQTGAFLGHELQYERWYVHRFLRAICGFDITIV